MEKNNKLSPVFNAAVVVAALGYFVDIYDLVLFLIIGDKSLTDLRLGGNFELLLNVQMIGMLTGGVFWGILGDRKGRMSVLFGSIITYSAANILNGFVGYFDPYTLEAYVVLRFFAGLGLAGELGSGITLVSEILSKEKRGIGTMIVASVGVAGAVVAFLTGEIFSWQITYFIGGGLGISLLLLRIGVIESGIFKKVKQTDVSRGKFFMLFSSRERAFRYINCILIGLPVWFVVGVLVANSARFAELLNIGGKVEKPLAVMMCYSGLILGDITSGAVSQYLRSRKKVLAIFYFLCLLFIGLYLSLSDIPSSVFYTLVFFMGFSIGFWAIFVTVAAEHFGTNLRATVTTTVPNFVRGSLALITILFDFVRNQFGLINAGYIVTAILFLISFIALYNLDETFGRDLDYLEKEKIIA